jgi:hypothetical protein
VAKNPYEWIYERESQPLKEYVLDEIAKGLAKVVEEFPPVIDEWEREDLRARFEPLLARRTGRPPLDVVREAVGLYRLELERDIEAIDQYMREERWRAAGLSEDDRELVVFLWQYWTEQTLAFKDYADGKFKWAELSALADRLNERLVERLSPLRPQ